MPKTEKYQPSNASEGCSFLATFCDHCKHDHYDHKNDENVRACKILMHSIIYSSEEKECPKEWTYNDQGPTCTKYENWNWDLGEPKETPEPDPNQLELFI